VVKFALDIGTSSFCWCSSLQVEFYPPIDFSTRQLHQLPGPIVGISVGVVSGTVGVVVAPVVGVGVAPAPVVGATVGLLFGAVGVAITPVVGVAPTVVVGLVVDLAVLPVLGVALIATPLASVVTVSGSGVFSKPAQFSPLAP
jgi:hypothetical protein